MSESIIRRKSEAFSVRIIKLSRYLKSTKHENVISIQIYRSGTSVSANVNEALQGSSKNDFANKMNIALKEAAETKHWLRLLYESDYLTNKEFDSIYEDASEIEKILTSIVKTTRYNIESERMEKRRGVNKEN
ncbi:MAG: four helix bundle protein [Ruminococcus sp.]|nr:four helix bundle protein [Ruminococcus sp.]